MLSMTDATDTTKIYITDAFLIQPNADQINAGKLKAKIAIRAKDADITAISALYSAGTTKYTVRAEVIRNADDSIFYDVVGTTIITPNSIERNTAGTGFLVKLQNLNMADALQMKVSLVVMLSSSPMKKYTSPESAALTVASRKIIATQEFLDSAFTSPSAASGFIKGNYVAYISYKVSNDTYTVVRGLSLAVDG